MASDIFSYDEFAREEMTRRIDDLTHYFLVDNKDNFSSEDMERLLGEIHGLYDYEIEELLETKFLSPKRVMTLSIFLGIFGADAFYLGDRTRGCAKLFTLGGLTSLWIYDMCTIKNRVKSINATALQTLIDNFMKTHQ